MKQKKIRGFTIPELVITLGMIAILMSVAVPSIGHMVKDNRLTAQVNNVVGDIHYARSEAASRGTRVILCRTGSPTASVPSCSGTTGNWSTGYIMFADGSSGADNVYDHGVDTLLRRGMAAEDGVAVRTNASWNRNLEINPNGSLNETMTAFMALCDDRGKEHGRQIRISLSGQPRLYSKNIANCTP